MKPRPFEYVRPTNLDEVLAHLADPDRDAKLLAGGQSLIPAMNFGLARPAVLVDLNRVAELAYIRPDAGGLAIGAMTRHCEVEDSPEVAAAFPVIPAALRHVGHRAIRHRGTVGGSLSHADPAAEWGALAVALDATLTVQSARGVRTLAAHGFFLGPMTTALEPDEVLTEIRLPWLPAGARGAFYEVARRSGDFALAGVVALLWLDADGTCTLARIGLCGVGPTPLRAREAEAALRGERLSPSLLAEAGRLAAEAADPGGDVHGSADYRKALTAVCVRRALAQAAGDATLAREGRSW